MYKIAIVIPIISILIFLGYHQYAPHKKILLRPQENHPKYIFDQVFSKDEFRNLVNLAKNTTFLMTSRADAQNEFDYGSQPIGKNGKCDNHLLHSNKKGDKCIIPARLDVGQHLMMTGGWGSKKEFYETLISRARFFQNFWADFNPEHPEIMKEVQDLFAKPDYIDEAVKICQGEKYLDPMQASILVALPGQEVGLHYDTTWFFGADRSVFPLWLLAAMKQSGYYEDRSIKQVQGVAYLHEWTDAETMGGGFFFYPKGISGQKTLVEAKPNRGLIVDGTVLAHGTQTFKPKQTPIFLDKDTDYKIAFNSENRKWEVFELDTGKYFNSYGENDVRITLVWRQRCFQDENSFKDFKNQNQKDNQLKVQDVIDNLLDKLVENKVIKQKPENELQIAKTIVDNYIPYPYPDANIPYNYCMIAKRFPATRSILKHFCD